MATNVEPERTRIGDPDLTENQLAITLPPSAPIAPEPDLAPQISEWQRFRARLAEEDQARVSQDQRTLDSDRIPQTWAESRLRFGRRDLSWEDVTLFCEDRLGMTPAATRELLRHADQGGWTNPGGLISYLRSFDPSSDCPHEFLVRGTDCTRYEAGPSSTRIHLYNDGIQLDSDGSPED